MYLKRTRLGKDIVAEFQEPVKKSRKVVIFLDGMPTMPGKKKKMLQFFAKKGYWAFNPRYRGTWESGGDFLSKEPTQDVFDCIEALQKKFTSIWTKQEYKIVNPEFYLIGCSFGGPAAVLASKHKKVKKVISVAGVVDWTSESKEESLDFLETVTKASFGEGYRFDSKNFKKLKQGKFYNPIDQLKNIDAKKILLIHAADDDIVLVKPVLSFAKKIGAQTFIKNKGGHLSTSMMISWYNWRKIKKFLQN